VVGGSVVGLVVGGSVVGSVVGGSVVGPVVGGSVVGLVVGGSVVGPVVGGVVFGPVVGAAPSHVTATWPSSTWVSGPSYTTSPSVPVNVPVMVTSRPARALPTGWYTPPAGSSKRS